MVVCRRKARPFVLSAKLGLQENGRPSLKGMAPWPGPCSVGGGATGSALRKGASDVKQTEQFRFAQRVNERGASMSAAGRRSDVSGLARDWEGIVQPTLEKAR